MDIDIDYQYQYLHHSNIDIIYKIKSKESNDIDIVIDPQSKITMKGTKKMIETIIRNSNTKLTKYQIDNK